MKIYSVDKQEKNFVKSKFAVGLDPKMLYNRTEVEDSKIKMNISVQQDSFFSQN